MGASQKYLYTLLGVFRDHRPTHLLILKGKKTYFKSDIEINFDYNQIYLFKGEL
jgi:hypothetical protein